ncbi:conserved hypothetical protein [Stenotrophomonas maltophilia]
MGSSVQLERKSVKAFYELLVERLGHESWAAREASYLDRIQQVESKFNVNLPVEAQLFYPADDDIDWYILASRLAYDFPYSDSAYSSRRVLPYAMAIGAVAEQLRSVPNVNGVLDRMLANKSKPETQLFELLTASFYLKNGYEVSFIPENSMVWPDGKRRSPDLLVKLGELEFYVECKRSAKQTKYSSDEEGAWQRIWSGLSLHLLKVSPWSTVDLTFHDQIASMDLEQVIEVTNSAIRANGKSVTEGQITAKIRPIDKLALRRHYKRYSVRPNSPQQELLVFGDTDYNEKRSIATVAGRVVRPGTNRDILNIFVKDVASCVGAQWRCDHELSLSLRSKHFKNLVNDGINQIPPDKFGVVHVWFETRDGIKVEELRSVKNIDNISSYDASESTVLAVFVHGVNYYPSENRYQTAETVQQFIRIGNVSQLFPRQMLMLSSDDSVELSGISHWLQDKVVKARK